MKVTSCVIFRFLMPYKLNLLLILWKQINILLFYFPGNVFLFSYMEFGVCIDFLLRFTGKPVLWTIFRFWHFFSLAMLKFLFILLFRSIDLSSIFHLLFDLFSFLVTSLFWFVLPCKTTVEWAAPVSVFVNFTLPTRTDQIID